MIGIVGMQANRLAYVRNIQRAGIVLGYINGHPFHDARFTAPHGHLLF